MRCGRAGGPRITRSSSREGSSAMRISFVATRKNLDPTERELYEMDLL